VRVRDGWRPPFGIWRWPCTDCGPVLDQLPDGPRPDWPLASRGGQASQERSCFASAAGRVVADRKDDRPEFGDA